MKVPWRIAAVKLKVTMHFVLKYMRSWDWDMHDLRDAITNAYKIDKAGKEKFEIYVEKSGYKKIITIYLAANDELLCITGSKGGKRK